MQLSALKFQQVVKNISGNIPSKLYDLYLPLGEEEAFLPPDLY